MTKKKKDYQIPFDDQGNLLSYPERSCVRDLETGKTRVSDVYLRDNYVFKATMTYHDFDNGYRSAHRIIWMDEEGHTYPMFISRFGEALQIQGMYGNQMMGWWTFVKQGQNYSIRAVEVEAPEAQAEKTTKRKKVKKAGSTYVHSTEFASMRQERDDRDKERRAWRDVCASFLDTPIFNYIEKEVKRRVKEK